MKKLFILLMIAFMLTACSNTTNNQNEPTVTPTNDPLQVDERYIQMAKDYVDCLLNNNHDAFFNSFNYDEQMQSVLNEELYESIITGLKSLGAVKEILAPSTSSVNGYIVVAVPVIFEQMALNLNVVLTEDFKIAGFNMTEYVTENASLTAIGDEQEYPISASDTKTLNGSYISIKDNPSAPLVILVHGSGANDRDETIANNKPFRDIAYGLAKSGIASYRYDKRTFTYGEEFAKNVDATVYDETINDVRDIVAHFKKLDANRQIIILGHSLGAYLVPRIAQTVDADAYIMMAAPKGSLLELMAEQIDYLLSFASEEEIKTLNVLKDEIDKTKNLNAIDDKQAVLGAYKAYWEDLESYDALTLSENIKQAVLVLQGDEDYQVPLEHFEVWKKQHSDDANWTFINYAGLGHLFMPADLKVNPKNYYLNASHVDDKVIEDIVKFINGD